MCGFLCTDTCQPKYLFQYDSLSYNYYYKTNRINKVNKNLPTIKQSTEVALSRANTLMDMADKILAKQSTDLVDESWMDRLWKWADDNDISLPRDRDKLIGLKKLDLGHYNLTKLPEEVGNLVGLTELTLYCNQLTELPKELQEWFDNIESKNILHSFTCYSKSLPTPCQVVKEVVHQYISLLLSNLTCK